MSKVGRFAGFDPVHLLLLVTAAELAFNRLATRELRPVAEVAPWWHRALDHFGLFCQYFASTLAVGIIVHLLWRLVRDRGPYGRVARWGLVATGAVFLALTGASLVVAPGAGHSFWLQTSFMAAVAVLVLGQLTREGDLGVKVGLWVLAVPMAFHYYGPLSLWVLAGEGARWSDLPERVKLMGQLSAVMVALVSPYCLAPRPLLQSATRLAPLVVAVFVGTLGALILRQHYELGMRLAYQALGIDIGPNAPGRFLAVYLIALATITWTLVSCITAESVSRRDIGVGLGLIVVGGYGFAWPLQYLVSLVGLMTIGRAGISVAAEERDQRDIQSRLHLPPINEGVWQSYVRRLAVALSAGNTTAKSLVCDEDGPRASNATVYFEDAHAVTHVVTRMNGVGVHIRVERVRGAITSLDILCGDEPASQAEPAWTMSARPEHVLGVGLHAEPPRTSAPVRHLDDVAFNERYRVRDAGRHSEVLLDDSLRGRAIAMLDGWIALWPGVGLRYRVHPGVGAPLDHPIPISELSFRLLRASMELERMLTLVELLTTMASRALPTAVRAAVSAEADSNREIEPGEGKEPESAG